VASNQSSRTAYMHGFRIQSERTKNLMIPVAVLGNIIVNEQGTARKPLTDFVGQRLAEILEGFCTYED
jgi:hypothetical protein